MARARADPRTRYLCNLQFRLPRGWVFNFPSPLESRKFPRCSSLSNADYLIGDNLAILGTLTRVVFPGPPNFEDVARGDKPESYFVLRLQQPACVNGNGHEPARQDILAIQLVLIGQQFSQFRPLLGKRVRLSG